MNTLELINGWTERANRIKERTGKTNFTSEEYLKEINIDIELHEE